jgi:hypothetical protein
MRTYSKQATISHDNHRVEFDLPDDLPEGNYQVLLVLEESVPQAAGVFKFPIDTKTVYATQDFSRAALYDNDGR